TVAVPRLAYPETEKPLEFGKKYHWRVIPLKGDEAADGPIVESHFQVVTKAEAEDLVELKALLTSAAPEELLLAAAVYEAHDVYGEALRLYERLAQLRPAEANYQIALAGYYQRAGNRELAEKARERARRLGAEL